jgi:hypothetical protein
MKEKKENILIIRPCSYLFFFELVLFEAFLLFFFLTNRIPNKGSDFLMFILFQVCFFPFIGLIANALFRRPSYVFSQDGFSYAMSPFVSDFEKYKKVGWNSIKRVVTWDLGSFGFWSVIFVNGRKFTFSWIVPEYFELLQFLYSHAKEAEIDERTEEFQSPEIIKKLKIRRSFTAWGLVFVFLLLIFSLSFEFGVKFW